MGIIMKPILFALLTTLASSHRFVVEFEDANQSEFAQAQQALSESEKQLGVHMNTPMFTEHAGRVERSREVDYVNNLENKKFLNEESEENQETEDSISEAKKEIREKAVAEEQKELAQKALE